MKCEHNDCFTCPYDDCISNVEVEPDRKKPGRKKLTPEEKAQRKEAEKIKRHERWLRDRERCHEIYIQKTEGKVKKRYRVKSKDLASYSGVK